MLDLKSSVTAAANQLSQRVSRAATGALGALTGSLSRAGLNVVDGVLAKASELMGIPEEGHEPADSAQDLANHAAMPAAPHGKAAAKKRKQARLSMQRLLKAAKRTASSARYRVS